MGEVEFQAIKSRTDTLVRLKNLETTKVPEKFVNPLDDAPFGDGGTTDSSVMGDTAYIHISNDRDRCRGRLYVMRVAV